MASFAGFYPRLAGSELSGSQTPDVNDGMRDRFVGALRLARIEEEAPTDREIAECVTIGESSGGISSRSLER